jgi:hypothetical protein
MLFSVAGSGQTPINSVPYRSTNLATTFCIRTLLSVSPQERRSPSTAATSPSILTGICSLVPLRPQRTPA